MTSFSYVEDFTETANKYSVAQCIIAAGWVFVYQVIHSFSH